MKKDAKGCLAGKTVLVSGGGSGLGAAVVRGAAQGGARLVVNCRKDHARARGVAQEVRQQGGEAIALCHDVTDYREAAALFSEAASAFGGVDIVVNTVGGFLWKPVADMEASEWKATIASNLDPVFNLCRLALPHMRKSHFGRIVCIASVGAERTLGQSKVSAYLAAKSAVVAFCKSLALEEARSGITVNVVCPGLLGAEPSQGGENHDLAERVPVGRTGSYDDVVRAILFFAEPSAELLTGQVLSVAGGWLL